MSPTQSSFSSGNTRPNNNAMFEEDGILTTNIHKINSCCKIGVSLIILYKSARRKDNTDSVTLVSWFKLGTLNGAR